MTLDVAAAAQEYLPMVECLSHMLAAAENRPISRSDLDAVWVRLPQAGTIASAELFRSAIKKFEEILQYEYTLRDEIDAPPDRVLDVSREVQHILAPIVESRPKPTVLLDDPGTLDRYFYALSNLGELVGAIASIEYERIKAGTLVRQLIGRLKKKLEGARNAFEWLSTEDGASAVQAPEAPGWWAPGGTASAVARNTASAERTWMQLRAQLHAPNLRADPAQYDAFISHAAEDKNDLVRPLAKRLRDLGFSIWYDEFELKVGDSLRRSIDRGLANSRFGIVVLSTAFFSKNWPQYELDGLVTKELSGGKVILPLWHKVSKDEVVAYSPSLADKLALSTAMYSVEELANELASVLRA
jgi:hypothetical protein